MQMPSRRGLQILSSVKSYSFLWIHPILTGLNSHTVGLTSPGKKTNFYNMFMPNIGKLTALVPPALQLAIYFL